MWRCWWRYKIYSLLSSIDKGQQLIWHQKSHPNAVTQVTCISLVPAHKGDMQTFADLPTPVHFCVQVVDDHHMMRLGLIALAQASGTLPVQWLEAGNLGDAMQMHRDIHQHGQPVDLVLLDLNLPDGQGLQGLRRFLREFPQLYMPSFPLPKTSLIGTWKTARRRWATNSTTPMPPEVSNWWVTTGFASGQ